MIDGRLEYFGCVGNLINTSREFSDSTGVQWLSSMVMWNWEGLWNKVREHLHVMEFSGLITEGWIYSTKEIIHHNCGTTNSTQLISEVWQGACEE